MDVPADAIKHILKGFEWSFVMGVVAANQYEVSDRFDELKKVGMPFQKMAKYWKPELHHVLELSTGPLFHMGKFVSNTDVGQRSEELGRIVHQSGPHPVLAINIFQKTNNPVPGVILKQALQ